MPEFDLFTLNWFLIMHQVNEIYNETLCNTQINCKLSTFLIKEAVKKIRIFLGLIPKPPPLSVH